MPRKAQPQDELEEQRAIFREVLEVCREIRSLFSLQQAEMPGSEKTASPELDLYRQTLGAGLDRLQGKFQEKLGESQRD